MDDAEQRDNPTQDSDSYAPLPSPSQDTKPPRAVPANSAQSANSNQETAKELAREFKWFEFLSVFVNAILAVVGIIALTVYHGQLVVMQGQLDQMKSGSAQTDKLLKESAKQSRAAQDSASAAQNASETARKALYSDQRPWIRIEFEPDTSTEQKDPTALKSRTNLETGQPISIPVRIRNTGKRPAESVTADFAIEIVGIDEPMGFPPNSDLRRVRITKKKTKVPPLREIVLNRIQTGIIFQDTFSPAVLTRGEHPLTFQEGIDMINGKMVYIIGRITYTDWLNLPHWTQFCRALSDAPVNRRCAEYNRTDSN